MQKLRGGLSFSDDLGLRSGAAVTQKTFHTESATSFVARVTSSRENDPALFLLGRPNVLGACVFLFLTCAIQIRAMEW